MPNAYQPSGVVTHRGAFVVEHCWFPPTGASVLGDNPMFGIKLDRSAALASPLLPEFWDMVDYLLLNDPVVAPFVKSHSPRAL